jgi:hypothetical protein
VEQLKECLATAKTTLSAMDGETIDARAANVVTHTELASELNFFASFVKLLLVLTLNLCVFQ